AEPARLLARALLCTQFVDNVVDEFRKTGGELVASPCGSTRRSQGASRRPPARHIPCGLQLAAGLRERGFSPVSTAPMTMTVLSIKERTTPSRSCAWGACGQRCHTPLRALSHPFSSRPDEPRRQFPLSSRLSVIISRTPWPGPRAPCRPDRPPPCWP